MPLVEPTAPDCTDSGCRRDGARLALKRETMPRKHRSPDPEPPRGRKASARSFFGGSSPPDGIAADLPFSGLCGRRKLTTTRAAAISANTPTLSIAEGIAAEQRPRQRDATIGTARLDRPTTFAGRSTTHRPSQQPGRAGSQHRVVVTSASSRLSGPFDRRSWRRRACNNARLPNAICHVCRDSKARRRVKEQAFGQHRCQSAQAAGYRRAMR